MWCCFVNCVLLLQRALHDVTPYFSFIFLLLHVCSSSFSSIFSHLRAIRSCDQPPLGAAFDERCGHSHMQWIHESTTQHHQEDQAAKTENALEELRMLVTETGEQSFQSCLVAGADGAENSLEVWGDIHHIQAACSVA